MIITKIEVQKKNKNRASIFVDDNFYCGVSAETIVKNHVKAGQEISESQLEYLTHETEREVALSKAVGYIAKAQKTKKEVTKYLKSKGFEDDVVEGVIEKLEGYKFVDDGLYAKSYIKFKSKTSGSRKIESELKQKGIDEKLIKESVENYLNDRESIVDVARKYLKNKPLDIKTKQKAYRYLTSRGYKSEDINFALNATFKEVQDDGERWD